MSEATIYKVPTLFLEDHLSRCSDCETNRIEVISMGVKLSTVLLTDAMWSDLYSDADYYASFHGSSDYEENKSIVNSAINTVKRLDA